jgi:hypothetical protein
VVEVFHLLRAPLGACSRTIATNCFPSTESLIGEEAIVAPVWKNQSGLPDPESTATKVASGCGGKHDATAGALHARGKRAANNRDQKRGCQLDHPTPVDPCREYHAALRRRLLRLIEGLPLARFIAFEISRIQCVSLTASTVTP